jgi:hypothetical protein
MRKDGRKTSVFSVTVYGATGTEEVVGKDPVKKDGVISTTSSVPIC